MNDTSPDTTLAPAPPGTIHPEHSSPHTQAPLEDALTLAADTVTPRPHPENEEEEDDDDDDELMRGVEDNEAPALADRLLTPRVQVHRDNNDEGNNEEEEEEEDEEQQDVDDDVQDDDDDDAEDMEVDRANQEADREEDEGQRDPYRPLPGVRTQPEDGPDHDRHEDEDDEPEEGDEEGDLAGENETDPFRASNDGRLEDAEEEEANKKAAASSLQELTAYSTRGRPDPAEKWPAIAAEPSKVPATAQANIINKDLHHPATGTSGSAGIRETFLSDSLTEEERRTRTRYLPDVDGMHALRKNEVKSDLALARTLISGSGATTTLAKSSSRHQRKSSALSNRSTDPSIDGLDSAMDVDDEGPVDDGMAAQSEDERMSDIARLGSSRTFDVGSTQLAVPNPAFVAPNTLSTSPDREKPSPRFVDAVAAFNPPRPPESVGAKKKHRMLRWERRPADMEIDLSNYRKTVQKTREELRNAQSELERITSVENAVRQHLLKQQQCLHLEMKQIQEELIQAQQECIASADLLTSRTRSRGAGKAMRDVLSVLCARGTAMNEKGLSFASQTDARSTVNVPAKGAGGVSMASFQDWDAFTPPIYRGELASAWIVPGESVDTPYGSGKVLAFFPPGRLNPREKPKESVYRKANPRVDSMLIDDEEVDQAGTKVAPENSGAGQYDVDTVALHSGFVGARVAVQLPFGIGFFSLNAVKTKEDPITLSDANLAQYWRGMVETALEVGAYFDIEANAAPDLGEGDEVVSQNEGGTTTVAGGDGKDIVRRPIPYGAGMLPTACGRGALIYKERFVDLVKGMDAALYHGTPVVCDHLDKGTPRDVKEREDQRQAYLELQAKVLQLRNELYRQRRIRILNERTYGSTQDRAVRVEALVTEMRTDLKNLKRRLDEEVAELGISADQAESILMSYYESLDSAHSGESSPPKRQRRHGSDHQEAELEGEGLLSKQ